jgi:hypothetical protein
MREVIDMHYSSQVLRLQTDSDYSKRLPIHLCGDLLRLLKPLMAYSVRMAVEGSSVAVGRTPTWLATASDVRFVEYARDGNDTLIQLDLPALGAAAPELYDQAELWATKPAPEYTAIDVLSQVVNEVDRGDQDSLLYDRHLLRKLSSVRRVFSDHLHAVALPHASNGTARVHLLTADTTSIAGRLADSTPQPQEVRIAGHLDMIRRSTRSFGLQLDDGTEVHGVLENADEVDQMREFFGKRVLILGKAIYRPSGSLLRIDAHAIEHGEGQPSIFSRIPPSRSRRVPQSRKVSTGQGWDSFSTYFGAWPGEETDEQWNEMLLELKK